MMNEKTRRLSKMPEEVRAEISPWFIEKQAIKEEVPEKIPKLDEKARYTITNLKVNKSILNQTRKQTKEQNINRKLMLFSDIAAQEE